MDLTFGVKGITTIKRKREREREREREQTGNTKCKKANEQTGRITVMKRKTLAWNV